MIKIVDYGMGNLRSVQKGFESIGYAAEICDQARELNDSTHLVLPGVGAFRDAIHELRRKDLVPAVLNHLEAGKPFLGICLGLQLLFDVSDEDGEWEGLGVLPGRVQRFEDQPGLKIPHMGWNTIQRTGDQPLWREIPESAHFYFVHSYHVVPEDASVVATRTDHGGNFVSSVARDNLFATQFHPEKSQQVGLQLLRNFAQTEVAD